MEISHVDAFVPIVLFENYTHIWNNMCAVYIYSRHIYTFTQVKSIQFNS